MLFLWVCVGQHSCKPISYFFMFFVQCLKLTFYVCLCTSVFVSAYADVSTSESATLSQIGLFVYDRATISLSNSQRKVLTLHAPHG